MRQRTVSANHATTNGGGIFAYTFDTGSSVTLNNSTASGNRSKNGGGIAIIQSSLTVTRSTLSGNSVATNGGGIFSTESTATLSNSTLSGNTADGRGGAFYVSNSSVIHLNNTTVSATSSANNSASLHANIDVSISMINTLLANSNGADCFIENNSILTNQGGNLVENDSNGCGVFAIEGQELGPLQDNGGDTLSHALLKNSPAIDAGVNGAACPASDARGEPRNDGRCDIGAYEAMDDGACYTINAKNGATVVFCL